MKYSKHLRGCWQKSFLAIGFLLLLGACHFGEAAQKAPTVRIALRSEPDRLNLLLARSTYAQEVGSQLFQSLLVFDPTDLSLKPLLAQSRPQITKLEEGPWKGGLRYDFEIRPEALWDNGEPILASDVLFTLKLIFNPALPIAHYRAFLDFIGDLKVDPNNLRRFSVYTKSAYILAEAAIGILPIYPAYHYDPEQLLQDYSLADLLREKNPEKLLIQAPRLQDFAAQFDKASVEREPGRIVGSGPYQLAKWLAGQRIQLEKKQSWWGDRLVDTVPVLAAIPLRLTYELLSKEAGLNGLLLSEEIDALGSIPPAIFNDLAENEQVRKNYSLHQPMQLTYYYIGLYNKSPKLSDRRVRRALAHLVDVPRVIDQLLYGSGQATIGPIHPSKPYYHRELSPIAFDPERAATLLVEAGWEDRNGDGRLDREVDGQAVELSLSYKFPQGNRVGESLGLLLQEQARKVGIDITLEAVNFGQLIREYGRRDFELVYLRLSKPPGLEDLKQSWHRSSDTPSGSNRVGFGTPESDELIDKIRQEFDREKRNDLYRQIQEIIYEEQACIFLYCPRERIALHQSLNAKVSLLAPGYFPQYFETVGHNNLNVPSYNSTK